MNFRYIDSFHFAWVKETTMASWIRLLACAVIAAVFGLGAAAFADDPDVGPFDYTFTGGGADDQWGTAGNWTGGAVGGFPSDDPGEWLDNVFFVGDSSSLPRNLVDLFDLEIEIDVLTFGTIADPIVGGYVVHDSTPGDDRSLVVNQIVQRSGQNTISAMIESVSIDTGTPFAATVSGGRLALTNEGNIF